MREAKMQKESKQNTHPKMALFGHDGNIFAILGRASRLLCENGQRDQSREMCERVYGCHSYDDALFIISEYVETELSDPDHMAAREKHQNQKNEVMPDEHSEQNKKEGMRLTNTENDLFRPALSCPNTAAVTAGRSYTAMRWTLSRISSPARSTRSSPTRPMRAAGQSRARKPARPTRSTAV